jgi:hypothetical protein
MWPTDKKKDYEKVYEAICDFEKLTNRKPGVVYLGSVVLYNIEKELEKAFHDGLYPPRAVHGVPYIEVMDKYHIGVGLSYEE